MKKIYLAGKWEERKAAKLVMLDLEKEGHIITHDWTLHEDMNDAVDYAVEDIEGVKNADVLVVLAMKDYPYKGAYCEFGAALALNKPVFVFGGFMDSCIFINHPLVTKVVTWEDFLGLLNEI